MSSMFDRSENLKREDYPLPASLDEVLDLVRSAVTNGSPVRKVIIEEARHSIVIYRDMNEGELEELELTLDGILRNANILEYTNEEPAAAEMLLDMHQLLHLYGLYPVCWVTGPINSDKLDWWLEMEARGMPKPPGSQMTRLGGFPVQKIRSLPEDVIILCGARYIGADIRDIELGVKANIELKENTNARLEGSPARDQVRDDSRGDAPAARLVEAPSRVRANSSGVPAGLLGARLADRRRVR